MSSPDLPQFAWRKSSRSNEQGGSCVEVAAGRVVRQMLVRDSKDPGGAILAFAGPSWVCFTDDLKRGRYDSAR
jgi:Domain of unknown function (DUF397)